MAAIFNSHHDAWLVSTVVQ